MSVRVSLSFVCTPRRSLLRNLIVVVVPSCDCERGLHQSDRFLVCVAAFLDFYTSHVDLGKFYVVVFVSVLRDTDTVGQLLISVSTKVSRMQTVF